MSLWHPLILIIIWNDLISLSLRFLKMLKTQMLECKGSIDPATQCKVKLYWNSTPDSIETIFVQRSGKAILFRARNDWSLLQHFVSSADFCSHGCPCFPISLIKPSKLSLHLLTVPSFLSFLQIYLRVFENLYEICFWKKINFFLF